MWSWRSWRGLDGFMNSCLSLEHFNRLNDSWRNNCLSRWRRRMTRLSLFIIRATESRLLIQEFVVTNSEIFKNSILYLRKKKNLVLVLFFSHGGTLKRDSFVWTVHHYHNNIPLPGLVDRPSQWRHSHDSGITTVRIRERNTEPNQGDVCCCGQLW